jgi:hypothetical protein
MGQQAGEAMKRTTRVSLGLFATWAISDIEELLTMSRTSKDVLSRLPAVLPVPQALRREGVSQRHFATAVGAMGLAMGTAAALGVRSNGRSPVFRGALLGFGLHGFGHLASATLASTRCCTGSCGSDLSGAGHVVSCERPTPRTLPAAGGASHTANWEVRQMATQVLVGANAADLARQFLAAAQQFTTATTTVASSAAKLADQGEWTGRTATTFAADQQHMAGILRTIGPTVERMAQGALSVIETIDNDDTAGKTDLAAAGNALMSGARLAAARSTYPPVIGWDNAKDGTVVVNDKGAFQPDHGNDYQKDAWIKFADPTFVNSQIAYAEAIAVASHLMPGPDAAHFFQHYLNGDGTDFHFDSTIPYHASNNFKSLVDTAAANGIKKAQASGQTSFDSGYIYNNTPFPDSGNWTGAVGGSFHRVVGHLTPDGNWVTTVQITSYYQFVPGHDFGPLKLANGAILHELEREGIAQDYHSLGTGTVTYNSKGKPISTAGP